MLFFIILVFIISTILSSFIIPRILVVAFRKRLFDIPNDRTVHHGTVPRLGGLSFVPTIIFSLAFAMSLRYIYGFPLAPNLVHIVVPEVLLLICGLTILYISGIKDDLVGLRYRTKFVIQIIVASFFPLSGLWINNLYGLFGIYELTPWLGIPFTILLTVFITNAINLIDGIDGLASGLSSVALIILGSLFLYNRVWLYAMLSFATLGVLLPFFYYNVFGRVERHNKIFMGDTGSLTLGYILAFLSIRYSSFNPDLIPYSEGAIVVAFSTLIVPMFDVIRVILVRLRTRNPLFEPDRNHIHHKFLDMGLSHRRAMLSILGLAIGFCCLNIILVPHLDNNVLFVGDIVIWTGLNLWFDKVRDKKKQITC